METMLAGMGTKLHFTPNFFTTLLKHYHNPVTTIFSPQNSWDSCSNRSHKVSIQISFDWLQESMDRLLEQSSGESVRNTMLKHEEIFKEQVLELHRLYIVQKKLMAELRNRKMKLHSLTTATIPTAVTDAKAKFWSSASTPETSHSLHVSSRNHSTAQLNSEYYSLHGSNTMVCPSLLDLTICSEDPLRLQKCFDLECSAEENTDTGNRATQDQTNLLQKNLETATIECPDLLTGGESDVELTLSIGCCSNQNKSKQWLEPSIGLACSKPIPSETRPLNLSTPVRPERGEECSNPSAGFDRESLQRPRWLYQALSLNRT